MDDSLEGQLSFSDDGGVVNTVFDIRTVSPMPVVDNIMMSAST